MKHKTKDVISTIWQETRWNGLPRRAPSPALLASVEEATTALPTTTRAVVTATIRPAATPAILLALLYICSPERLSAMHL